jgi:hypothetical protein
VAIGRGWTRIQVTAHLDPIGCQGHRHRTGLINIGSTWLHRAAQACSGKLQVAPNLGVRQADRAGGRETGVEYQVSPHLQPVCYQRGAGVGAAG